jgi:hypothetical protein
MRNAFASLAALALLSACDLADLPSPKPTSQGEVIESSSDLTIGYGSVGPAKVGMTKREALDTGLFERATYDPADSCTASALAWKSAFKGLEIRTDTAGTIKSLRIVAPGPRTQYGIQVGSDLADMRGPYASALMGPAEVGAGSGHFVKKENRWIGFFIPKSPDDVDVLDKVTLIEVTDGAKPQLQESC